MTDEVIEAAAQSNVLLELIQCHLYHREHRLGEDFTGKRADEFNFGFDLLAYATRQKMEKAIEDMTAAVDCEAPEVAS